MARRKIRLPFLSRGNHRLHLRSPACAGLPHALREFLRIDFPRIPFPGDANDFEALSRLGWALVQTHLLRELPRKGLAQLPRQGRQHRRSRALFPTRGGNRDQQDAGLQAGAEDVWNFHIGGYQVLDKYLKSRKGRKLTLDEINHVAAIADSLAFTIEQMTKIDQAYQMAFDSGDKSRRTRAAGLITQTFSGNSH